MTDQLYEFEAIDDFDKHFTRLHNYLMFLDIKANSLKLFMHYARFCNMKNHQATPVMKPLPGWQTWAYQL
jgi:hypothetical protein